MYIPLSYRWILKRSFEDGIKTVLDVGCGEGKLIENILGRNHNLVITGLDIHDESLQEAKERGVYKKLIKQDLTKANWNKINGKKYDLVFCSQLIEHISKKDGKKLLKHLDKYATKRIVVTTPHGFLHYRPMEEKEEKNPYQKHKSGWTVEDFMAEGYRVYGQGLKAVYGEYSLVRKLPRFTYPLFYIFSFLFSPILYLFPNLSYNLIAIKEIKR